MSHGIIVRTAGGGVSLDTGLFSMRTIYSQVVTVTGQALTLTLPDFDAANGAAWCHFEAAVPEYTVLPTYTVTGNTITISPSIYPLRVHAVMFR